MEAGNTVKNDSETDTTNDKTKTNDKTIIFSGDMTIFGEIDDQSEEMSSDGD
jgi:hypothetical protein